MRFYFVPVHMATSCSISDLRRRQKQSPCPGLFRIVQSKDGGICRIKLPFGQVSAPQARAVAEASQLYGNGEIEVTNRANFQIRGVRPGVEDVLIQHLLDAGLGPKDAGADDIRNVMVSASVGGDDTTLIDVTDLARQILALIESDARYHALSPKLSILLDGGESGAAVDHPHDLWFSACDDSTFAFGFAGHPPFNAGDKAPAGFVEASRVQSLCRAALDVFIEFSAALPQVKRFRDIAGDPAFTAALLNPAALPWLRAAPDLSWLRAAPDRTAYIGKHPQKQSGTVMVGGVPALGRIDPQTLIGLADLSVRANGGVIRLTPWQSVLLPDVPKSRGLDVLEGLRHLGFAVSAADPMSQMVACSGTTGCASAVSASKEDAKALAVLLKMGVDVHVTACPKSCSSARTAAFTLVAVDALSYDLYRRDCVGQDDFGSKIQAAVSIQKAAELLA